MRYVIVVVIEKKNEYIKNKTSIFYFRVNLADGVWFVLRRLPFVWCDNVGSR